MNNFTSNKLKPKYLWQMGDLLTFILILIENFYNIIWEVYVL